MKNEIGITKTQVKILFFAATITLTSCDDNFIIPPPPISPQPQDRTPAWSPDGQWIAYFHFTQAPDTAQYSTGIYLSDEFGQQRNQISKNFGHNPDWSPDGKKIAWTIGRGGGEIWIMEADGSNQSKLVDGVEPSWSPDSEKIVFARAVQPIGRMVLWIIDIDGTNSRQLTN